jgi:hypothetical protein
LLEAFAATDGRRNVCVDPLTLFRDLDADRVRGFVERRIIPVPGEGGFGILAS